MAEAFFASNPVPQPGNGSADAAARISAAEDPRCAVGMIRQPGLAGQATTNHGQLALVVSADAVAPGEQDRPVPGE